MTTKIDQKAYLQKYLSGPSGAKKKKKKKVIKGKGLNIIDEDIDISKLRPLECDELDVYGEGEDAPQVAGIIDERPEDVRKLEQFQGGTKWRVINQDDGFNSKLQIEEIKKDKKQVVKENEYVFGKMYSDSEDEKKDSDASPPRKPTNVKKPQNSDSDLSPPRRKSRSKSPKRHGADFSPPRKNNEKSRERVRKPSRWGDVERRSRSTSPKKSRKTDKRKSKFDSDSSAPRKSRKVSPKRNERDRQTNKNTRETQRSKYNSDSDASPPRKKDRDTRQEKNRRNQSDSDESPPRRDKKRDLDESPERKKERETNRKEKNRKTQSDSDASPPRREKKRGSDESPPRKKEREASRKENNRKTQSDSDASPPRREKRKDSASPARKRRHSPAKKNTNRRNSDSDPSPPRRRRNSDSPPPTNKKMAKTLEGKLAGLQDAKQLREENQAFRRREEEVFKKMTDDVSGRNAQAVSRKGKRETSEERKKQKEKSERQKVLDEKYKKWNRGLKQIADQESRQQDFLHEASKPLARLKNDVDLERSLKVIEREGDPMLGYIRDRRRERGELGPEKPMYKGNFAPNRFNVRPGYRWDGVDRSNGYEKKYFEQQSKRKAMEEERYKWSTEDL